MVTSVVAKTNGNRRPRRRVEPTPDRPWPAVTRVSVERLFNKYDYLDVNLHASGSNHEPLALLYGANGSGKTTLLKMIYASLSPALNEGLRTYVARTPFRRFRLDLLDGSSISVSKKDGLQGSYRVSIDGFVNDQFDISVDSDGDIKQDAALHEHSSALRRLGIDLLYVRDDRRIQTTYRFIEDDSEDDSDIFISGVGRLSSNIKSYRSNIYQRHISPSSLREVSLFVEPVIAAVNDWIKDYAYRLGSSGDQDASFVYLDVLKALKRKAVKSTSSAEGANALKQDLFLLSERSEKFNRYGLISQYPFNAFIDAVSDARPSNADYMSAVLVPFVDSIKKRLNALESLQHVLERLETALNSYLRNKHVELDVLKGITFHDENGEIEPSALSSGERQLVFLFSAALLSRDGNSIFIVDEPELSLNFEWQREVVGSLLDLAEGGRTQFIMASHSIEILTKHRNAIVKLA